MKEDSIYERLGGQNSIDTVVDIFYKKVLADDSVNYFFIKTDMERQIRKQREFLSYAFGGPTKYDGKRLIEAHKNAVLAGLNDSHFDTIVKHLSSTLFELAVDDDN